MTLLSDRSIRASLYRMGIYSLDDRVGPASLDLPISEVYHVQAVKGGGLKATRVWVEEWGYMNRLDTNGYYLAVTREYYRFPRDTAGFITMRSTYARLGVFTPITFIDPGFEGNIVIEFMAKAKLYSGNGFEIRPSEMFQLVFVKTDAPVSLGYSGRYQGQRGLKVPGFVEVERKRYGPGGATVEPESGETS